MYADAHIHLNTLTWKNLEDMYMVGIRTIISPVHLDGAKPVKNETIIDMWDYLLEVHMPRAKSFFIEPYAMIGISMVSTPEKGAPELYAELEDYLKRPEVVAIGEIGLEPGSRTCKDMAQQAEFVVKQLKVAKNVGVCVDFHVPNAPDDKKKYTEQTIALCEQEAFPMDKVIIDHCSEANIDMVLKSGANAAISIQPFRNMTPEKAADLAIKYDFDRIMLDSDSSSLPSDPLAVARGAMELKKRGVSGENINRVCFENCKNCYGI
jgi:predicted metal-dependent TIM-barrel fold hydrolase